MVILHMLAPAAFGGLECVVQGLARGLRGSGHEVHVTAIVADQDTDAPFLASLADAGVHTRSLVMGARAYLRERAAIAHVCREVCPDVVHTHGYRPDVLDAGVARRLGIPVVTTVHGFTGGRWKNGLYEWLQCRAFRKFDAVVAVSQPQVRRLQRAGVAPSRIHVVPNAWHDRAPRLDRAAARQRLGIRHDAFVVGWVGRLSREKGPDVLLEALPRVRERPFVVSVVGTGVERTSLEARASRLGLEGRIRWHGAVADASQLFSAFDLFVLSSRTEGTPMVLFEAMAAGVPIVATRVGGVPDVLSASEAVLVPSDDPDALAAGIRAVYERPGAARARADAARARLERDFRFEPWLERYEAIYRQISRDVPAPVPT